MIRVRYAMPCWELKWVLSDRRWNRGFKFEPTPSVREANLAYKKRMQQRNKHTMGSE